MGLVHCIWILPVQTSGACKRMGVESGALFSAPTFCGLTHTTSYQFLTRGLGARVDFEAPDESLRHLTISHMTL